MNFATSSVRLTHPSGSETELFFVRHGQTSANVNHQFAGITDLPLDDTGKRQAERVAQRFREIAIDKIVSSPLQRAHHTAKAIAGNTGHTPIVIDDLREMNFGDAEMMTFQEIIQQFPSIAARLQDPNDATLQWPNGESRSGFHHRILSTISGILARNEDQRVAVVCHGGVIASILSHLENGPRNDFVRYRITNCSITHMSVLPRQTLIHTWNDYSHLSDLAGDPIQIDPHDVNGEQ